MMVMVFADMVVEIVVGHLYHSTTLVADGFHMLSDVLSLAIALFCVRLATRKSSRNTFGWVRLEVLGALVNGVFLVALCLSIFIDAVKHFVEVERIGQPMTVLIVAVVGLVVNLIGIAMFHGHAHGHAHRPRDAKNVRDRKPMAAGSELSKTSFADIDEEQGSVNSYSGFPIWMFEPTDLPASADELTNSEHPERNLIATEGGKVLNMRGVFLHLLGDLMGSVIAMVSAGCTLAFGQNDFVLFYVDPILSIVMVVVLVVVTIPLLKESSSILLEDTPRDLDIDTMTQELQNIGIVDGIITIHELHVWRLTEDKTIASVHIILRDKNE
ncbi:zinc transporter 1 [Aphelenchoides avenae]|nr:zinc transporter 1 [Aphelenchus avenae]